MQTETNWKEINRILESIGRTRVIVSMFSPSLWRIGLRISQPGNENEVSFLIAAGCKRINGPFRMTDSVVHIETMGEGDDLIYIISDKSNNFELLANAGVVLAQGHAAEFGSSFDNFLSGKPT
jgi:hypothetical protein